MPDLKVVAADRIREAVDAGRLPVQPSDDVIALVIRAWREARRQRKQTAGAI